MLNTYPSLVLAYLTGLLPFTIWLSRRFFDGLPVELEDAGLIDGCGRTRVFVRIVLPLSVPAISTIGVLVGAPGLGRVLRRAGPHRPQYRYRARVDGELHFLQHQ